MEYPGFDPGNSRGKASDLPIDSYTIIGKTGHASHLYCSLPPSGQRRAVLAPGGGAQLEPEPDPERFFLRVTFHHASPPTTALRHSPPPPPPPSTDFTDRGGASDRRVGRPVIEQTALEKTTTASYGHRLARGTHRSAAQGARRTATRQGAEKGGEVLTNEARRWRGGGARQ